MLGDRRRGLLVSSGYYHDTGVHDPARVMLYCPWSWLSLRACIRSIAAMTRKTQAKTRVESGANTKQSQVSGRAALLALGHWMAGASHCKTAPRSVRKQKDGSQRWRHHADGALHGRTRMGDASCRFERLHRRTDLALCKVEMYAVQSGGTRLSIVWLPLPLISSRHPPPIR